MKNKNSFLEDLRSRAQTEHEKKEIERRERVEEERTRDEREWLALVSNVERNDPVCSRLDGILKEEADKKEHAYEFKMEEFAKVCQNEIDVHFKAKVTAALGFLEKDGLSVQYYGSCQRDRNDWRAVIRW